MINRQLRSHYDWHNERQFHLIKQDLRSQVPSLGEPRAAIFALCLALAAGNILMVLKALERTRRSESVKPNRNLSGYYVTLGIGRTYMAVESLTTSRDWQRIAKLSQAELLRWSRRLADQIP